MCNMYLIFSAAFYFYNCVPFAEVEKLLLIMYTSSAIGKGGREGLKRK